MDESTPRKADKEIVPTLRENSSHLKNRVRPSAFKYYIHDSIEACRLQLFGELTEASLSDLDGCWRTARTTLGNRKLILDVRALSAVDDAGKRWLASIASEGATFRPETYLRDGLASQPAAPQATPASRLSRLLSFFRGSRVLSSTQAQ